MPKKVDHGERRERIAAALMTVAADRGLEGVSLRHVATAAGATSGLVQHYFPTKDAMMDYALLVVSARFEARITAAVAQLGPNPTPRDLSGALLTGLLPMDESQRSDARVALAFLSYGARKPRAADALAETNAAMRTFLAEQIRHSRAGDASSEPDPQTAATGLFAAAEGLAVHVLSAGLPVDAAVAALNVHLDLVFGAGRSPAARGAAGRRP